MNESYVKTELDKVVYNLFNTVIKTLEDNGRSHITTKELREFQYHWVKSKNLEMGR
jgi:hypothetical protein